MKTTSVEALRPVVPWMWKFLVSCCNPFLEKMEKALYILLQVEKWRKGCHSSMLQWGIRPCHKKEAWKLLRSSLSSIMPQGSHRIFVSPTQRSKPRICPTKSPHSCSCSNRESSPSSSTITPTTSPASSLMQVRARHLLTFNKTSSC